MSEKITYFLSNYKFWLVIIIVLAVLLRLIGIKPGFPPYHSDEGISYSAAVSMIKNGNIDPLRYDYPAVVPLVNAAVFKSVFIPLYWLKFYVTHFDQISAGLIKLPLSEKESAKIFQLEILGERERNALFWGRLVTALFGMGVVFLSFFLGKSLFNKNVGLISAFLVSINYKEVLNSHLGLPDIYNAFFLLAATLGAVYLWEKPTSKKYIFTSLLVGLSFSTKYQLFALLPLAFVHIDLAHNQEKIRNKIKHLFRWEALLVPLIVALLFVILNPYHIVNFQETLNQVHNVSLKYGIGQKSFYLYPYAYLYHIGIGQITSILILLGIILGIWKFPKKSLLLLLVIIPFFSVMTYYSTGGFYTRNFVTIIPVLLIFAGLTLSKLMTVKFNKFHYLILFLVLTLTAKENLVNSIVVTQEYTKPWNYQVLAEWIDQNIPNGSKVAAISSVPLPDEGISRLPNSFEESFSVDEFREDGADYAIAALDWATNQFYDWMKQAGQKFQYWTKPIELLDQTYSAMAIRELAAISTYAVLNPWQAPESGFIVVKIPQIQVSQVKEIISYTFDQVPDQWTVQGQPLGKAVSLPARDGQLEIGSEAVGAEIIRWESPVIDVGGWPGFLIKGRLRATARTQVDRSAYLTADFYQTKEDLLSSQNRVGVRISKRIKAGDWEELELVGTFPNKANFMTVSFRNYNPAQSTAFLDYLVVSQARVEENFGGAKITPLQLDNAIIFPNSHGNL